MSLAARAIGFLLKVRSEEAGLHSSELVSQVTSVSEHVFVLLPVLGLTPRFRFFRSFQDKTISGCSTQQTAWPGLAWVSMDWGSITCWKVHSAVSSVALIPRVAVRTAMCDKKSASMFVIS